MLNLSSIAGLSLSIACFLLALTILINSRTNMHRLWALFNISVSTFGFGSFLVSRADNLNHALLSWRIFWFGLIFIAVLFYHLVIVFSDYTEKKFLKFAYSQAFIFAILALFTDKMSDTFIRPFGFYYVKGNIINTLFFSIWWVIAIKSFLRLYQYKQNSKGIKRLQAAYLYYGMMLGFVSGSTTALPCYGINVYPVWHFLICVYAAMCTYAILKYRLMDIRVAISRATAFLVAYPFLLGIPFFFGYRMYPVLYPQLGMHWWLVPSGLLVFFATLSPLAYDQIKRKIEDRLLSEERQAHHFLTQASGGMMRIRSIKHLINLIVNITTRALKLENACIFLLDEADNNYKLEAVRLKSRYNYSESIPANDSLIERLSRTDTPLVLEELKQEEQELKAEADNHLPEIISQIQALSIAVIIPAISRGILLGFLALGEKCSKRMYSTEDLNVLWVLSNQAALAIENARFHQKAQEELLKDDREMTARFIGHGASHQFGNLLNRILQRSAGRGMDLDDLDLDTLSLDELKKIILAHKDEFNAITRITNQGKEIVSGILSIGSGSPIDFKEDDLKSIVSRAVEAIKLKQTKEAVEKMSSITEIITNIPDNLPKIWCNSLQVEQVLNNMLDNDLEAIEERDILIQRQELIAEGTFRGKIVISAEFKDGRIFLSITDNGIGIKPEDLKKMFVPFFTTKATERLSRKGHGIGMHVVESIIKVHQGKIYVASTEYGKGTTFMIEFPIKITENKKL